jgi:hypothetical protein
MPDTNALINREKLDFLDQFGSKIHKPLSVREALDVSHECRLSVSYALSVSK